MMAQFLMAFEDGSPSDLLANPSISSRKYVLNLLMLSAVSLPACDANLSSTRSMSARVSDSTDSASDAVPRLTQHTELRAAPDWADYSCVLRPALNCLVLGHLRESLRGLLP